MKTHVETSTRNRLIVLWVLLATALVFAPTAALQQGGNFTIRPSVVAGGGGASAGGNTSVAGTIGQSALGLSSGGQFALNAGFWQGEAPCSIPMITSQPVNQIGCEGASISFSVTVSDNDVTYQWRRNGANLAGATTASLTLNNISSDDAATYDVVVSKPCGVTTTSNAAILTVNLYALAPTAATYTSQGGTGSFNIGVAGSCLWTANSNAAWLTINAPAGGSGNGVVSYSVAANSSGGGRVGTITVAGKTFTVTQASPTAIKLVAFAARQFDKGVFLEWETGFEVDNLGFNIYRDAASTRTRVNPELIAGSALVAGSGVSIESGRSYTWWDSSIAECGLSNEDCRNTAYWLEDVDLSGTSTWHGPFFASQVESQPPARAQAATVSRLNREDAAGATRAVNAVATIPKAHPGSQPVNLALAHAIKIGIREAGFYSLSQGELVAAGLHPSVDPRRLQLFVDGKEIPIEVSGEADGKFDAADEVQFYGLGLDTPSTDTRIYWLVAGAHPGKRISKALSAKGVGLPQAFAQQVERRDRTIYFPALKNGEVENFFGAVITTTAIHQSLTLSAVAPEARQDATLVVALQGVTATEHRVLFKFNGNLMGYINFTGQSRGVEKMAIPQAFLKEGENQITLQAVNNASDMSLVDFISLTYQRIYQAEDDQLIFTAQGGEAVNIGGFTTPLIKVFDVTDANNPQALSAMVRQSADLSSAGYAVTVVAGGAGERRLLALADSKYLRAAKIQANQPSSWRRPNRAADFLIIGHRSLLDGLKPLVELRVKQGLQTVLVDVEDIYDEFSFGHKSPQSIREFIAYASSNWSTKPGFLMFVGDASYDPRNYLGSGDADFVPTKLIETLYLETACDDWFADFTGDGIAELSIGRLPARSIQETALIVKKIMTYEEATPANEVLLVADRNDGFDFESALQNLRPLIPANIQVEEIFRSRTDDTSAKNLLLTAMNRGPRIVNYNGHGNIDLWRGNLLSATDAAAVTNANRLSLFVLMTCLNGYFQHPVLDSLGESFLKAEGGGAVAVWASSGMCLPQEQAVMNEELYRLLFAGSATPSTQLRLGEAVRRAKAVIADPDIRLTWTLLGDPTMRVQ